MTSVRQQEDKLQVDERRQRIWERMTSLRKQADETQGNKIYQQNLKRI